MLAKKDPRVSCRYHPLFQGISSPPLPAHGAFRGPIYCPCLRGLFRHGAGELFPGLSERARPAREGTGRLLDTIFAHRPECGLLYLCADTITLDYIAWLWHLYYDSFRITVLVDERPAGPESPASLTLHEAMRSPPKGYPAGY